MKHTLTLVRKSDDDAIFRARCAGRMRQEKSMLVKSRGLCRTSCRRTWKRWQLYKTIESKASIPVAYRARQCDTITVPQSTTFSWRLSVKTAPEKPRWVVVGFQTNRDGDQERNPSIFDHCDLKNMCVMLNQEKYPAVDY